MVAVWFVAWAILVLLSLYIVLRGDSVYYSKGRIKGQDEVYYFLRKMMRKKTLSKQWSLRGTGKTVGGVPYRTFQGEDSGMNTIWTLNTK